MWASGPPSSPARAIPNPQHSEDRDLRGRGRRLRDPGSHHPPPWYRPPFAPSDVLPLRSPRTWIPGYDAGEPGPESLSKPQQTWSHRLPTRLGAATRPFCIPRGGPEFCSRRFVPASFLATHCRAAQTRAHRVPGTSPPPDRRPRARCAGRKAVVGGPRWLGPSPASDLHQKPWRPPRPSCGVFCFVLAEMGAAQRVAGRRDVVWLCAGRPLLPRGKAKATGTAGEAGSCSRLPARHRVRILPLPLGVN